MAKASRQRMACLTIIAFILPAISATPLFSAQLTVYVQDMAARSPINFANVSLVATLQQHKAMGFDHQPVLMAAPQGGGAYRIDGVAAGEYVLQVLASGYGADLRPILIGEAPSQREVVGILASGRVSGLVTDAEGRPLRGAEVNLSCTDDDYLELLEQMSAPLQFPGSGTNYLGEFVISNYVVPNRNYVLEVGHEDFLPVLSEEFAATTGETAVPTVILSESGIDLIVEVVDASGQPVTGAAVSVKTKIPERQAVGGRISPRDPRFSLVAVNLTVRAARRALTETDGGVRLRGLRPGEIRLRIRAPGFEPYAATFEAVRDMPVHRVVLSPLR